MVSDSAYMIISQMAANTRDNERNWQAALNTVVAQRDDLAWQVQHLTDMLNQEQNDSSDLARRNQSAVQGMLRFMDLNREKATRIAELEKEVRELKDQRARYYVQRILSNGNAEGYRKLVLLQMSRSADAPPLTAADGTSAYVEGYLAALKKGDLLDDDLKPKYPIVDECLKGELESGDTIPNFARTVLLERISWNEPQPAP